MAGEPIDDVLEWSNKLSPWKQDALRRLATSNDLTKADDSELLAMVKSAAGVKLSAAAPNPVPFTKAHFGGCHLALKHENAIQAIPDT